MYRLGKHRKGRRRRLVFWLVLLLVIAAMAIGVVILWHKLRPHTVITTAAPHVTKVVYQNASVHYEEPDFGLDLPAAWEPLPRPPGPYQTYSWQTSQAGTKGQEITVYEDTIPANFAVNRVLIVEGQVDHLQLDGSASDNCSTFTKGLTPEAGQVGVPAKWQSVSFLCDQFNQERDVIGTSSADGVNTVVLKSPSTGTSHKFFFSYTNQDVNPDYTAFYSALQSLRMN